MQEPTPTMRQVREAKSLIGRELLAHPDVHGIGIGYKRTGGRKTSTLALVVHVYRKRPADEVDQARRLPSRFSFFSSEEKREVTVPIDVREALPPVPEVACADCKTNFGARVRPVPGGFSFGLASAPGGTLGGYVWDTETDQVVFLSNEHVLGSVAGATVIQPSIGDGGSAPNDNFGQVLRAGTLDAAIGRVSNSADLELEIECSGPAVYEITDAILDMEVEKAGQTTGLTCGIVELIDYDSGHYGSHNDLWIDGDGNNFSEGGDSGSLYVEKNAPEGQDWKRIVGIHWGGSGDDGVGHPIRAVFTDLNLDTVCSGMVNALLDSILTAEDEAEAEGEDGRLTHLPGPPAGKGRRARFHHGFARDFEKRIRDSEVGSRVLHTVRDHRAQVVNVLRDGDGWRAAVAALAPVLRGKVTTDEVLEHSFTAGDVERFQRLMQVAARLQPRVAPLLEIGRELLSGIEGATLASLVLGEGGGRRRRRAPFFNR